MISFVCSIYKKGGRVRVNSIFDCKTESTRQYWEGGGAKARSGLVMNKAEMASLEHFGGGQPAIPSFIKTINVSAVLSRIP